MLANTFIHIIFYAFATLAIGSALYVITTSNPVRSVLALVVTFFAMTGIWLLLSAEFLALILLLVYVGAVMTLFLFVVMMLNIDTEKKRKGFVRYLPFGALLMVLITGLLVTAVAPGYLGLTAPQPAPYPADYSNISALGGILFTQFAYPFEIAGVILLAAIIAAIALAHRGPVRRKVQSVDKQVAVRPEDRVRLVSMPAETYSPSAEGV